MNEYWIVYRDVEDFPRKQFEKMNAPGPGEIVIKAMVIPGAFGLPPTYIGRYEVRVGKAVVHLITYTERELSDVEVSALAVEGLAHVDDR